MKQNLANRLAGGGFWALKIAESSVEVAHWLREQGNQLPNGMDSDTEVFTLCGAEAFKVFCNVNMDQARINLVVPDQQRQINVPKYDRYNRRIPHEMWENLHRLPDYRQIAKWEDETGITHVSTVWVGFDANGCDPPHLFKTFVVRFEGVKPCIQHTFDSHSLHEAIGAHRQAVSLVQGGRI